MSTLKTINVIHPSGSTNNIVNDASGNITVGGTATVNTVTSAAATALTIKSAGTTAMTVDTSQNVGIGTSSPRNPASLARVLSIDGGNSGVSVSAGSDANTTILRQVNADGYLLTYGSGNLILGTGNTEAARIDTSGNFLVGTTSLVGNEKIGVNGTGTYVGVFQQSTNTSGYHVLRCGLQANGNNTSTYFLWGNTNTVGNWYLYGNGTTSFTSDSRLKKNIETTRNGYLDDVAKLRVVKYNWRNDENGKPKELGLIAQEVAEVFPGLVQDDIEKVSPDDDTMYKTLKQSVLPFILLKAIQELKAQNDALTARVAALEAK